MLFLKKKSSSAVARKLGKIIFVYVHTVFSAVLRLRIRNDRHFFWEAGSGSIPQKELWRAVKAHNGGVETQNGALEGL
jgi:hypothetical protein